MKRAVFIIWMLVLLGLLVAPSGWFTALAEDLRLCQADKVAHFFLFGVTGFLTVFCTNSQTHFHNRIVSGAIFGLVVGFSTEFAQAFMPGRDPSLYDFLANVVGLAAGMVSYAGLYSNRGIRSALRL